MIKKSIFLIVFLMYTIPAANGVFVTIEPTDVQAFRYENGEALPLNGLGVKKKDLYEDRTFAEYDISGLTGAEPLIELYTWVDNIDPDPPDGVLDIFGYEGDGIVTGDDFYAGGATADVSYVTTVNIYDFVSIDITAAVQAAVSAGWDYLGLRISTETDDRYWLDNNPDGAVFPVLHVTPEPGTVLLLGLGGVALLRRRKI